MPALEDLIRTLRQAIDTGRVGTPVSMRVYLLVPETHHNLTPLIAGVLDALAPLLGGISGSLQTMGDASGRQRTVLLTTASGRTLFLTAVRTTARSIGCRVLLTGNHGVATMSSGIDIEWPADNAAGQRLAATIDESSRSSTRVAIPAR